MGGGGGGANTWSNRSVKGKVGLSVGAYTRGGLQAEKYGISGFIISMFQNF